MSFFSALVILSLFASSFAHQWSSVSLPSPQNDPGGLCGRKVRSSVCDPDGYLSESDADEIQGLENFINQGSHGFHTHVCPEGVSGPQLAVAVVGSMQGGGGRKRDRAFKFAKDLHDRWGVGDKNCQNGIVLFFAVEDHAMGFSTGAGVRGLVSDDDVQLIMGEIKPLLKISEYGPAIIKALQLIGELLSGEEPSFKDATSNRISTIIIIIIVAIFISCIVCAISMEHATQEGFNSRCTRYDQCRKIIQKIDADRAKASAGDYVSTTCSLCLLDLRPLDEERGVEPLEHRSSNSSVLNAGTHGQAYGSIRQELVTSLGLDPTAPTSETTMLPCGHEFHERCLAKDLVERRSGIEEKCPVCGQAVLQGEDIRVEDRTNGGNPSGWDVYEADFRFRLEQVKKLFPDFVAEEWNRRSVQTSRDVTMPMSQDAGFTERDPRVIQEREEREYQQRQEEARQAELRAEQARASGSSGATYTFDGGSSGGGGGGDGGGGGGGDW